MEENYNNNQMGTDGQSNYMMNQGEYQQSYAQSQYSQSQSQYGNPNTGYNQQNYGNSNYQSNFVPSPQYNGNLAPVMTVGDWIVTTLLLSIPLVNIVLLFVWAFDSSTNPNKKNFCRAALIFAAIGFVLMLLVGKLILGSIGAILGGFS